MVTTSKLSLAEGSSSATVQAEETAPRAASKTSMDPLASESANEPLDASDDALAANTHSCSGASNDNNSTAINTANTPRAGLGEKTERPDTAAVADDGEQQTSQQNVKLLPKASPPPQIVVIPASASTQASTVANSAAKRIRRAFSMPRNPFRWSHKLKTSVTQDTGGGGAGGGGGGGGGGGMLSIGKSYTLTSCVGGNRERSGSFVSLQSNEGGIITATSAASQDPKKQTKTHEQPNGNGATNRKLKPKSNTLNGCATTNVSKDSAGMETATGNHHSGTGNRVFRRSSFRKFINRITQHMTNTTNKPPSTTNAATNGGHTITAASMDRVPPIGGYQWPTDQTPGVMGLKNHGNTCFMNAVLQCLSHTDILAEYFVLDQYKVDLKRRNKINSRKFGTKGELTEQLANVLKALWTCKNESDHSTSFKAVVDRYGSQFRSSTQHDAQEFLFWLLDKVHEDLNTATKRRYKSVKNNYGRPDEVIAAETLANHIRCNNSFVQAVFQAQFRSSLTCPRCKKQSNTFDPFHCISVQLPQLTQQTIFVTVVYMTKQPRQVRMGLTVTAGSPIVALREQLHKDTGIPCNQMVLVDLQREGYTRVFYDSQPVNTLQGIETIYCIEVPAEEKPPPKASEGAGTTSSEAAPTTTASANNSPQSSDLLVLVANAKKKSLKHEESGKEETSLECFGAPFCLRIARDCSYAELQKRLLKEMSAVLKPEVFSYTTPLKEMFQVRLQDPSADPDSFIQQVEHPLLTEMIDLALSVLSAEAGPPHIKLLLEWSDGEAHFSDLSDQVAEHESVPRLLANKTNDTATLTLEQCLEHYTKAETLSAEDAWRCPHCQEYLPVVKTLGLWSLPDILVVHFKRFRQHHGKGTNAAKLTTMVTFPLHSFDMSPHLAKGANETATSLTVDAATHGRPSPWRKSKSSDSRSSTLSSRENRETRYDLYAVCYHQGDTLETGHYTAACKNPYDRQWYKFDDQRVSKVASEAIPEEIVNNEAYMLFYQRRASDNVECSGSSSNSSDHWISRIAPPATNGGGSVALQNSTEKLINESIPEKLAKEDENELMVVVEKTPSKDIEEIKPTNGAASNDIKEAVTIVNETVPLERKESNANSLDAIEQILDYADAEEIAEEQDVHDGVTDVKQAEVEPKAAGESMEIFTMDEDCKLEELPKQNGVEEPIIENGIAKQLALSNGTAKEGATSPLEIKECNGFDKKKSPMSSHSNSSNSLASQSSSPVAVRAVPQHGPNNAAAKFNGFSPQSVPNNNDKEHLLSTSLKSNSSSIISSALAGHFPVARQPWHGSRSSVSAVENAVHPTSLASAASVTSHPSLHLRHSFSTASNYRLRECSETLSSVLRNSVNTCSKDTLIFLDQQQHHNHHHHPHHHHHHPHHRHHHSLMEDDDDSFMGSRSLWISPVTPHKLITVSPKN